MKKTVLLCLRDKLYNDTYIYRHIVFGPGYHTVSEEYESSDEHVCNGIESDSGYGEYLDLERLYKVGNYADMTFQEFIIKSLGVKIG